MRKRIGILLSIIAIVIGCCACGSEDNKGNSANSYITMAQEFVDAGDYDAALKILEKGYKETEDAAIAVMMAELSVDNETVDALEETTEATVGEAAKNVLEAYRGTWADEYICAEYGGMIMSVYPIEEQKCRLELQLTQGSPMSRIANVVFEFDTKDLVDNCVELKFDDDGWGNEGTAQITFEGDYIYCTVFDTRYIGEGSFADWGLGEGLYELVRNEDAFECLTEDTNDDTASSDEGIYDPMKASGILAEAGLTEQEFREICEPLSASNYGYNTSASSEVGRFDRYHLAYGIQYYTEHPDDTDVDEAIEKWNDICKDYENGGDTYTSNYGYGMYSEYHKFTKYQNLDVFLNDTVYAPKGEDILAESTQALFDMMKEYPNEYLGRPYVLIGFNVTTNNDNIYVDDYYLRTVVAVNDLRDDVHNPNVMTGEEYYLYVIFEGTFVDNSGKMGLKFSLLSLEKCE